MSETIVLALGVSLAFAGPAAADPPEKVDEPPGGRAGIEKARAAGVTVDPAAEEMMARAAVGSCANYPTQPKCGKVKAVVYSNEFFGLPAQASTTWTARASRKVKGLRRASGQHRTMPHPRQRSVSI